MRAVVTGGAGFIGANLVRELEAREGVTEVVVIDDLSTGARANLHGTAARVYEASITDDEVMREVAKGADAIVHLAARPSVARSIADPVASHHANATGTLCVLEAARHEGVDHVVVASSSSVYGATPTLPKREDLATRPLSPYAASKLVTEAYTLAYGYSYGLATLAFRFFNVFGPLQPAGHAYAAAIPAFLDAALSHRAIALHGDGKQTRDFTYVGSVVRVLADAVERRISCEEPVNLAFGSRRSLLDVVTLIESRLGRLVAVEHTQPRPGDVRHSQADATRLRELFPDAEPVAFEIGLAETIRWFEAQ